MLLTCVSAGCWTGTSGATPAWCGPSDQRQNICSRGVRAPPRSPRRAPTAGPRPQLRVRKLPQPVVLDVDGFGPVVFCHGTPRDYEEMVLVDTRLEKWAEVFADLPAEVQTVVGGHTHMPFVRLVDRRLVINSGSIGMPYGRPGGSLGAAAQRSG